MERFNRMLQVAQGMGMSNAAPGAVSYVSARVTLTMLVNIYLFPKNRMLHLSPSTLIHRL